ncbi:ATP-binding protein [Phenylobacterium sp.]|jgi:hypothetical protein|uniref:ATP-binding protein n=1 Tax=Phenylobacterium sp. TaxID=1871053 RepID=UPI002F3F787E
MSPEALAPELIATSISRTFLPRLRRTHDRRRISVFAGPPGVGKSTSLRVFRAEAPWCIGMVSVPPGPRGGLKPAAVLHLAIEALMDLTRPSTLRDRLPSGFTELRHRLFGLVCEWAGLSTYDARRDGVEVGEFSPLTLIFDEAQNLSPEAIETLRFLNDAAGGFSPLPLGLIFVGNNEFVLKSDRSGHSVLSSAVADRALYTETYSYSDVTDDDLALFFEARGIVDPAALRQVIRYFGGGRADRSFRRAADLAAELLEEAGDGQVTEAVAREILSLV